jgi:hypothetical protein
MPEEHQSRYDDVEGVESPDRAGRQLKHVDAVHRVARISQYEVATAVGTQFLGARRLDQHGQRADSEQDG